MKGRQVVQKSKGTERALHLVHICICSLVCGGHMGEVFVVYFLPIDVPTTFSKVFK